MSELVSHDCAAADLASDRGLVNYAPDVGRFRAVNDCKVTWCELATASTAPAGRVGGLSRVARAETVLSSYRDGELLGTSRRSRLGAMAAEAAAIDVIADLLHWLQAHGHDTDEILDRAQMNFEAEWNAAPAHP
ncbi:hypothetical protein ACFYO5_05465 [Streptomyces sp. NPDC006259]|uniref:hypothetical protein n=1 Tax=Streptomyces sp. NPDC006259 TaxID=3364740 RepID=UPI0036A6BCC8